MAASPRTPKTGLLRKWILLGERKKLIVVAVASVFCFMVFKAMFFTSTPNQHTVAHTLTSDERVELEAKIRQRVEAAHKAEIDRIEDETRQQLNVLREMVEDEVSKKEADEALLDMYKKNMTSLEASSKERTEAIKTEYRDNLDNVLSEELARAQKEIIETRADEMLTWFCSLDLDSNDLPTPVTEAVVYLGPQPCIGVASEGDPPSPVTRYSLSSPDVARTVAQQAMASLKNRTGADRDELYGAQKLALGQFDPRTEDRCCDSFVFGVHPVFGVFYNIRLPLTDANADGPAGDNFATRNVCFRRKFHPKPVVKPMTTRSEVSHLTHPDQLRVPTGADGKKVRSLKAKKEFVPGTVHVILPFRAQRLDIFPSLIKNFGRIKQVSEGREATPFRIIVAPISWDSEGFVSDAKERMEAMIAAASAALDISITLAEPLAEADMNKETIVSLIKPWIDTSKKLLKGLTLNENADPVSAGVLPNPWLAAVLGAMKLIDATRAPILILDSATYSLPNNLIKKTLWRIVNGRMVYSPISSAVDFPIEAGYLLSDGGVSKTSEELEETGTEATYTDADFWSDVEDIRRFMDMGDEGGARRRLRTTTAHAADDARAARRATGRRLLEADGEGEGDEEAPAAYDQEEDDYYTTDPYGEDFNDYLMDLTDDANEWDAWDPDLIDGDNYGYGLGDEFGDADDPHNYFFGEDAYDEYEHYYEDLGEDETELLQKRVTTLGASKSDIASMLWRVLEAKPGPSAGERIATPQGDNCLILRMLSVARQNKYRIVRNVVPGLYVDKAGAQFLLGAGDPEVYPCECEYDTKAPHCRLVLAQTEVDDPIDETRVNCVITSLLPKEVEEAAVKEHDGKFQDIDVAKLVKVTHAVRFFKPSKGIEIVAKVLKADESARRRLKKDSPFYGPEVFSFQWKLSNTIRTVDDMA